MDDPAEILRKLQQDPNPKVREAPEVVRQANLALLRALLDEIDAEVAHENVTGTTMAALASTGRVDATVEVGTIGPSTMVTPRASSPNPRRRSTQGSPRETATTWLGQSASSTTPSLSASSEA